MKILLINGSPKKNGCTNRALEEFSKTAEVLGAETEIVWIGNDIQSCLGCFSCKKTGICIISDSVNEVAEKLKNADALIVGSPVHYAAATGAITAFLDRLSMSAGANFSFKPGAAIVSCRRAGATTSLDQLNKYFTINNMPIVSSQYWNIVHGSTPEQVEQDLEGLQTMRQLAKNTVWLVKSIEAGKSLGINQPELETREWTNFIR